MGFGSIALGIGKTALSAAKGAVKADPTADSSDNSGGTSLMDKITKWSDKRKQRMDASKNMGANDLTGVAAQTDGGSASAKKGGKVKREGLLHVHEGERILTKAQTKKYDEGPKSTKKAPKKTAKKAGPRKRA